MSTPLLTNRARLRSNRISPLAGVMVAMLAAMACGGGQLPSPTASSSGGSGVGTQPSPTPAATPSGSSQPTPVGTPGPLPLGDRLVATVAVDGAPCALAATDDAVYVTSNGRGRLDRIDPTTNQVTDHIQVGGGPCGIAVDAAGLIWFADLRAGAVHAIDPATRAVVRTISDIGPQLWDLKAGFGSIWAVDRDASKLLRIDPGTGKFVAAIDIGPQASGLAILRDAVWVSDDADGNIRRIDPETNKVVATIPIGLGPSWFADDGNDRLVIAQRLGGTVQILDPLTGHPGGRIAGWHQPLDGTVSGDLAWIPDGAGSSVLTVTLADGRVAATYALAGGKNPFVAEAAFGSVWILDFGASSVWRIRP